MLNSRHVGDHLRGRRRISLDFLGFVILDPGLGVLLRYYTTTTTATVQDNLSLLLLPVHGDRLFGLSLPTRIPRLNPPWGNGP